MPTIWMTTIAKQYRAILTDLSAAIRTCPDDLWEASLYPHPQEPTSAEPWTPRSPEGRPFDDDATIERMRHAQGAVWRTVSHALFFTDADLSAMEPNWAPQPPLTLHDEDENVVPSTYSRDQLQAYLNHCLSKVDEVFADLTDERAELPVADTHRHHGTPVGEMLVVGLAHLQQHVAQVRAFLVTRGVPWTAG